MTDADKGTLQSSCGALCVSMHLNAVSSSHWLPANNSLLDVANPESFDVIFWIAAMFISAACHFLDVVL